MCHFCVYYEFIEDIEVDKNVIVSAGIDARVSVDCAEIGPPAFTLICAQHAQGLKYRSLWDLL